MLEVEDISIAFGGIRAVDGISFSVGRGDVFAIIGPNGAGKTSVFNLVSRVYPLGGGRVRFEDRDISRLAPHAVAQAGIARTFQNIKLFDNASVLDNLMLGRYSHNRVGLAAQCLFLPAARRQVLADRARVEEVIEFLELERVRDKPAGGLPYGVRKVIELGRALLTEPRLLLLDEPSSGLSPEERHEMIFWIQDIRRKLGITLLMIEHDMNLVSAVSNRVLAMNHGTVLATGTPQEVQAHPAVVTAYLGT